MRSLQLFSTPARWLIALLFAAAALASLSASANSWPLPAAGSRLIGQNVFHVVADDGGSLEAIAKKYNVGFLALLQANPGVDPYVPRAGSVLTIPRQMLLPDAPREGLVVNLAELRVYYYPAGKNSVTVYPIGIGQLGGDTMTPTMQTTVSDKRANPTWTPTANIRARYLANGIKLPANADFGIGMRVSSGCIRLRDNDIKALYKELPVGTPVRIINEPIKTSVEPDGRRLVEVHQPLSKSISDDPKVLPIVLSERMKQFRAAPETDAQVMEQAMQHRSGMPVEVNAHAQNADTI